MVAVVSPSVGVAPVDVKQDGMVAVPPHAAPVAPHLHVPLSQTLPVVPQNPVPHKHAPLFVRQVNPVAHLPVGQ